MSLFDESVEFVPAGDGHWKMAHPDLAYRLGLHSYGHPALPGYAPAWEEEEDEEEWGEEEDEEEPEEEEEEEEVYPLAYTQCHLAPGEGVYAHEHARHKGQIIDEDLLSPGELAILHKAKKKSAFIQGATTAGGALAGVLLGGGPLGGAIGGAAGNVIGEAISPTPNRVRNLGRYAGKALWGAVGGGLSPLVFGGALAPWAATAGGYAAGRYS